MTEIPEKIDLANCDREPIHIPGSIQPQGCLLACDFALERIARHSRNAAAFLGIDGDDLNGLSVDDVLGRRAAHTLRNALAQTPDPSRPAQLMGFCRDEDARRFDVAIHEHNDVAIVEFEPHGEDSRTTLDVTRTLISRLRSLTDLDTLFAQAARLLRGLLGYDRIMVYRFAEDGSGSVVCESRSEELESFLGQHFPASDIPQQARALYLKNTIRVIGDAGGARVDVVPRVDSLGAPLDLSYAHLRSVSPIHCEYLRNMGVAASMSISIIVGGRLWGMIACHHYAPRRLTMGQRVAAELFGEFFSLQLEAIRHKDRLESATTARRVLDRLLQDVLSHEDLHQLLGERLRVLSGLLPCDGVALWIDGAWTAQGSAPSREAAPGLMGFVAGVCDRAIWSTHELSAVLPEAETYRAQASGVLAVPLSQVPRDYLLFFRREVQQTVQWAGDPNKTYETGPLGDRLTPRRSFAIWKEEVDRRSAPWTDGDREIAEAARVALLEVILRQSEVLEDERRKAGVRQKLLNEELNHRVKNILALIKSLISQPVEGGTTLQSYVESLKRRIMALSFAHDQVVRSDGGGALRHLLDAELSPYRDAAQIVLDGPAVSLAGSAFSVLTLVIHELATNAAKYGALSRAGGTLAVSWSIDADGGCALRWRESGGPPVVAPARQGFGSVLIDRSIPYDLGGSSEVEYRPEGVVGRFRVPARFVTVAAPGAEKPVAARAAPAGGDSSVRDLALMVVEDQLVIAMDVETMLLANGARAVRTMASAPEAMRALESFHPDAAVLDVNLGDGTSIPVADELRRRGIPFVFATGYGDTVMIPAALSSVPVVRKPYDAAALVAALAAARAALATAAE